MKLWGMVDFKRLLRKLISVTIIHIAIVTHLNRNSHQVLYQLSISCWAVTLNKEVMV